MQAAHARHYATMLTAEVHDGRVDCRREIDNIRAALRWASGPVGDRELFVRLAAVSAPYWLELSLLTECAEWMARAIAVLSPSESGTRTEMCLCSALGFAMMFTTGMTDAAYDALAHALKLADSVGDLDYQMRNMFALSVFLLRRPDFKAALALAHQCQNVAAHVADPMARPTADWMLGLSQFCLGDIANGRANMERVRDLYRPASRRAELVRFGFDQRVYAMGIVGLARWIEGFPEQAIAQSQLSIDEAEAVEHPVSLCVALWTGCLVSLWVGDTARLRRLTGSLLLHTDRHALRNYHAYGLGFDGELACLQGEFVRGMTLMRASIDGLRQARHLVFHSVFLSALAKQAGAGGDITGGLTLIDEALERAERSDERWFMPELLRIKASLSLLGDPSGVNAAEALFTRSLALAEHLGGRSWRLRSAIDLGRLLLRQGRGVAARDLLTPVLAGFTEGLNTADPQAARALLDEVG
jgi:predicted ATPase